MHAHSGAQLAPALLLLLSLPPAASAHLALGSAWRSPSIFKAPGHYTCIVLAMLPGPVLEAQHKCSIGSTTQVQWLGVLKMVPATLILAAGRNEGFGWKI